LVLTAARGLGSRQIHCKKPSGGTSMKRAWLPLFGGIVVLAGALITIVNAASPAVSQVVTFNPALSQLPESIAIDKRGNIYVSFFVTGEIRQIAPNGTQSTLAILGAGPFPRRLSGLAVDASGDVYALLNDIPATRGVWRISRNGSVSLIAPIPTAIGVNALAFDKRGSLFVPDPFKASIYRVGPSGSVTVWVTNLLLQGISPTTSLWRNRGRLHRLARQLPGRTKRVTPVCSEAPGRLQSTREVCLSVRDA